MELKSLEELSKLIDLCRKKGIKSFKTTKDEFQAELTAEAPLSDYQKKKLIEEANAIPDPLEALKEQEKVAFWSSDVFPGGASQ